MLRPSSAGTVFADAQSAAAAENLGRVEALLDGSEKWCWPIWNYVNGVATPLDALVALGRAQDAMEDATRHAVPGTYLEPFALRTLGVARGDAALLARAQQRFEEMGFDSHAAQTRSLGLDVVG